MWGYISNCCIAPFTYCLCNQFGVDSCRVPIRHLFYIACIIARVALAIVALCGNTIKSESVTRYDILVILYAAYFYLRFIWYITLKMCTSKHIYFTSPANLIFSAIIGTTAYSAYAYDLEFYITGILILFDLFFGIIYKLCVDKYQQSNSSVPYFTIIQDPNNIDSSTDV